MSYACRGEERESGGVDIGSSSVSTLLNGRQIRVWSYVDRRKSGWDKIIEREGERKGATLKYMIKSQSKKKKEKTAWISCPPTAPVYPTHNLYIIIQTCKPQDQNKGAKKITHSIPSNAHPPCTQCQHYLEVLREGGGMEDGRKEGKRGGGRGKQGGPE